MIDVGAAFELSLAVLQEPNPSQHFADFKMLWDLRNSGGLDFGAMKKAGTLRTAISALARTTALADKYEGTPHGAALEDLLVSITAKD